MFRGSYPLQWHGWCGGSDTYSGRSQSLGMAFWNCRHHHSVLFHDPPGPKLLWRHACKNSNTNMDSMCPPETCREARHFCRLVPPRRFASCMASSSSESSCPLDSAGHPGSRAQPLVALVHFRMAVSGQEFGSYWSPVLGHGACKYVSFGDSEVYDSCGLCLTKYDLVASDDRVYGDSYPVNLPSACRQ